MLPVLLTALGVGGATVFGAAIGFMFKKLSHTFSDIVLSFAAGVMLSAAVIGLVIPSLEYGEGRLAILVTVLGIFNRNMPPTKRFRCNIHCAKRRLRYSIRTA